jgi:hypothetical protein
MRAASHENRTSEPRQRLRAPAYVGEAVRRFMPGWRVAWRRRHPLAVEDVAGDAVRAFVNAPPGTPDAELDRLGAAMVVALEAFKRDPTAPPRSRRSPPPRWRSWARPRAARAPRRPAHRSPRSSRGPPGDDDRDDGDPDLGDLLEPLARGRVALSTAVVRALRRAEGRALQRHDAALLALWRWRAGR